jgi:hypothetical protein
MAERKIAKQKIPGDDDDSTNEARPSTAVVSVAAAIAATAGAYDLGEDLVPHSGIVVASAHMATVAAANDEEWSDDDDDDDGWGNIEETPAPPVVVVASSPATVTPARRGLVLQKKVPSDLGRLHNLLRLLEELLLAVHSRPAECAHAARQDLVALRKTRLGHLHTDHQGTVRWRTAGENTTGRRKRRAKSHHAHT